MEGYNFIWTEVGSRAEEKFHPKPLWTVNRNPALTSMNQGQNLAEPEAFGIGVQQDM